MPLTETICQTGRNTHKTGWFSHHGRGRTDPFPEPGPENLTVNEGLNPIDLIFDASPAVQLVFLILLTLSIVSWVIIVQRWLVLSAAQKGVLSFEQRFWSGMDLSQLYKEGTQMQQEDLQIVGMENIFRAGFKEFMRLRQQSSVDGEAIMEGLSAPCASPIRGRRKSWKDICHFWLLSALFRRISACLVR